MPSQVVNVARYSALVGGIGYGILHRRTLQKRHDVRVAEEERKHQLHLLEEQRKRADQELLNRIRSGGKDSGVISDPENPQFDLEKWLLSLEK
ncbi:hypothetical protein FA10DRAFT_285550 [Acaromyces ingoldii]|uniref:ATP synthase F(0) complex subunit e, mitochondrial n=1 Tax=Acaromyces ingoldii TaxID=215250 RepID=A0A316YKT2_9BASI|nr:hypothetical protein FA10DRAFT_285550 [Acaromyces ingoldii]PWN89831.1 hypothetical protein FA10DRAFT_285550 [Acaromyces ingoldii]